MINSPSSESWGHLKAPGNCHPRGSKYPMFKDTGPKKTVGVWFFGPETLHLKYLDPLGMV